ncbi:MAG: hypothetical protein KKF42_08850 [Actinobacteria bacterium]|nr:hypothetical protein [Actinomycetota bacterium]
MEEQLNVNEQQSAALADQIATTTDPNELAVLQQESASLYTENGLLQDQWNKQNRPQYTSPEANAETGGFAPQFQVAEGYTKNEAGQELTGFHGTSAEPFDSFDNAKIQSFEHGWSGAGHYFTVKKDYAEGYADAAENTTGKPGRIAEARFSFKNPLYKNSPEYKQLLQDALGKSSILNKADGFKATEAFKAAGYDAVIDGKSLAAAFEINVFDAKNIHTVEGQTQFQSTENQEGLSKVNLEDIKKAFPNQEIIQDADGNVSVKFKNGQGLTIKSIQTAGQGFVKLAIETGQMSKAGKILGITIGSDILLDENFADNKTLWHENKHVLDNLGMITPADDSALNAEFNKLRKANKLEFALSTHEDAKQRMVENRANTFAQIMVNRESYRNTTFGKTIQRIMDFFQQMLSFGQQTVSGLAREVETGKIYERLAANQTLEGKELMQVAQAFYSRLQSAVFNDFPAELKAQKVIPYLKSKLKNTNEQRPYQEIQAIGLQEWLAAKKPTDIVTKEELSNFVKANMVELDDVVLSDEKNLSLKNQEEFRSLDRKYIIDEMRMTPEEHGRYWELKSAMQKVIDGKKTHFSQYTEPGAVDGSYREMFITAHGKNQSTIKSLPEGYSVLDKNGIFWVVENGYESKPIKTGGTSKEAVKKFLKLHNEVNDIRSMEFENHWGDGHSQYSDIKNPIVRIRFNEINADGKRILRIEEMQGPLSDNQAKMPKHLKENIYQLGIKRVLAYAKENGFDGVSLVTRPGMTAGETQADRYSLENQVDSINAKALNNGKFYLEVDGKDGNPVYSGDVSADALESHIGKELAKKIITDNGGTYSGLDLKVGGEGLKTLYDKTIPAMLESYGNGKLESIESNINEDVKISKEEALNTFDDGRMIFIGNKIAEKISDIMRYQGTDITIAMPMMISYLPITDKTTDSFSMFQVAEQKILQVDYEALKSEKNNLLQNYAQQARIKVHEIKLLADKALGSISTRLKNVDPELSEHLRWLDFKTSQKIIDVLKVAKPILDATNGAKNALGIRQGGMTADEQVEWNWARLNSDKGKIEQLAQKYNLTDQLVALREKLNQLCKDAITVGYDVNIGR